jgi:hypothetical protein
MQIRPTGRTAIVFALGIVLGCGMWQVLVAQEAAAPTLTKPLGQFTLGDIFPKLVTEGFAETGKQWGSGASEFIKQATARRQNVEAAIKAKSAEIPDLKKQLSAAKKEADLVKVGTLEGTIKNEQNITSVLEGLNKISDAQVDLANKWRAAGSAMEKFTAADANFDQFRAKKLSRPEAGQPDERLGPEGAAAFRAHSEALKELGRAFADLGAETETIASARLKLLDTMAKGGNVQAPK